MSEKEVAILSNEIKHMNEKVQETHDMLKCHIEKEEAQMERLLETLDRKYSGKWVERTLVLVLTTIGLAFLGGLIALVIK